MLIDATTGKPIKMVGDHDVTVEIGRLRGKYSPSVLRTTISGVFDIATGKTIGTLR